MNANWCRHRDNEWHGSKDGVCLTCGKPIREPKFYGVQIAPNATAHVTSDVQPETLAALAKAAELAAAQFGASPDAWGYSDAETGA